MYAEQRQARILAEINRTGGARITDLGTRLGVSGVTARRDVAALAERGLVARVRGGAMALTPGPALAAGPGPTAPAGHAGPSFADRGPAGPGSAGSMGPGLMRPGLIGPGLIGPGLMGPGLIGPGSMGPGLLGPARPGSGSVVPDSAGPGFAGSAGLGRAKAAIARAGARLVRPAQAVGILAGRTTMLLTWELLAVPGLTVVTNAIEVADAFHHDGLDDQTVVLLGGVRSRTGALTGPVAERTAAGLNLDVVFLSVYGMAVRSGFTTPDRAEARTSAALIAAARRVVVLADHGKWGVRSAAVIAPLDGADVLVTDPGLTAPARATLRRQVGDLIIADPP